MEIENNILNLINKNKNILLVGPSDSGKSFFIKNKLIPFLRKNGKKVRYYKDLEQSISPQRKEIIILDEFEILEDKEFLEKLHPEERPYYSDEYINRVLSWFKKIENIDNKFIYILTRNREEEIKNVKNIKNFSFAKNITVLVYNATDLIKKSA